jgi:group I intron endonuclease
MIGYIYRITNIKTNQHYIGQTIDINRRKRKHFRTLRDGNHDNPKLQASWNKYGEDNFEFEFWEFEITSLKELNELECEYIDKYSGLTEGFNLIPGGGKPPLHQKVSDDDIATFLCI